MYDLRLTKSERSAIDWVGHRYDHGDKLRDILTDCEMISETDDVEWCGDYDIEFLIPEHKAWEIQEIVDSEDGLVCFSRELIHKILSFCAEIV